MCDGSLPAYRPHCIRNAFLINCRQLSELLNHPRGDTKMIIAALRLCVLTVFLAPVALFGQAVYGSISGNVTDSSDSVLPDAKVVITDTGKCITTNTTTNESDTYTQ